MISVAFGWVIFRAKGLHGAFWYIKGMLGLYGNDLIDAQTVFYCREYMVLIMIAAIFCVPIADRIKEGFSKLEKNSKAGFDKTMFALNGIKILMYCTLFIFSISYLVMGAHNPFIYFNF